MQQNLQDCEHSPKSPSSFPSHMTNHFALDFDRIAWLWNIRTWRKGTSMKWWAQPARKISRGVLKWSWHIASISAKCIESIRQTAIKRWRWTAATQNWSPTMLLRIDCPRYRCWILVRTHKISVRHPHIATVIRWAHLLPAIVQYFHPKAMLSNVKLRAPSTQSICEVKRDRYIYF